jgi:hypothetical protein
LKIAGVAGFVRQVIQTHLAAATNAEEMFLGPDVHPAAGHGRGAVGKFIERVPSQDLKLI